MKLIPIIVKGYSGYKADEYPKSFILDNLEIFITEITDRWYQGDNNPDFPVSDYFKVKTSGQDTHILKHEVSSDRWYLCRF